MKKVVVLLLLVLLSFVIFNPMNIFAEDNSEQDALEKEIEEYKEKISDLKGQQKTLSDAILFFDTKINLTQAQISKTQVELSDLEEDIATLSGKINTLNISLDNISSLLLNRISTTYKRSSIAPVTLLFSSQGFSDFLSRLKYLRLVQHHDRRIIFATEQAKANYDSQKDLKLTKQTEVEALNVQLISQKATLARQQIDKKQLLTETKNNEANYQNLLAQAYAELQAIQSVIAGKGTETEVGTVNTGDSIASIIMGESVCSTGTHVHFEVVKNKANYNPAEYLKSTDINWNLCGWWGCDEPFNFSGNLDWPISQAITITQGYGMTAYARAGHYGGRPHTGIDMVSNNLSVKSVKEGTLYRGSYNIQRGCKINGLLRYVKLDHGDNFSTYYFHVNYI